MNENLDLIEILKGCPKGVKFYSSTYGEVEFLRIESDDDINPITIKWTNKNGNSYIEYLTKEGTFRGLGECTLFPDKNQRDWSKWQRPFVDGDIIFTRAKEEFEHTFISIFKEYRDDRCVIYVAICPHDDTFHYDEYKDNFVLCYNSQILEQRLATEDEKQKLFDAIKAHGYRWNAKTKTLENLIVPKFDPKTLKPFDKVLVRDREQGYWRINLFSHYVHNENNRRRYYCIHDISYKYCIPYNDDTKHLVGTDNEAPEFYRYWED